MASGSMNSKTFGSNESQYFATLPIEDLLQECELDRKDVTTKITFYGRVN